MPQNAIVLLLIAYLIIVNAAGFLLMRRDKLRAQEGAWRVREAWFFAVSLIGGGIGCLAGMFRFRHKTRHVSFLVGIPLCMVAGLALYGWVFFLLLG